MNSEQAKIILAAYRPDSSDADDPQVAEALDQCRCDPHLREWFEAHMKFQRAMRDRFRAIPIPPDLAAHILSHATVITPARKSRPRAMWAIAAMLLVVFALVAFWFRPVPGDTFSVFRTRMVRTALREYRMDVVTNDMSQIRQFLRANSAPADYQLPVSLERLSPTGAGLLSWQGERVSMVCFDAQDKNQLFLFIVNRTAVRKPPANRPEFAKINNLATASWSEGEATYLLAAPFEEEKLRGYF